MLTPVRQDVPVPLSDVTVSEWMQQDVATIAAERTVREVLEAALGTPYDCVVIVDAARRPLGIVTEGDAVRRVLADEIPGGSYLRSILASPDAALRYLRDAERAQRHTAADIMSSPVHAVAVDDNLLEVARKFQALNLRQLVVVTAGAVAGLITRRDLMRAILAQHEIAERSLRDEPGRG